MDGDPERFLTGLDPEQRDVAVSSAPRLAVIAGAGTGKTRAITHRIAYNVAVERFTPRAVLAVTFTTKAAGELRGRLRDLGLPRVAARTFHSAALRQARHFWPRAMGTELPDVLGHRLPVVAEAASRARLSTETGVLRDLSGEISWAKVSNVSPADYPELARGEGRDLASATPEQIAAVFGRYEEAKRRRGVIDFEDILLCAALLLADHPEIAAEVRATYRHLVVDEYQDVSPLQERLLDLWLGPDSDLCVVGDPAQTIHSFAGARAAYLTDFENAHPGAHVIRLVRDYRSTEQVVALANQVNRGAGMTLVAHGGTGPEPEFVQVNGEQAEAAGVADWVARIHGDGVPYREIAALYRINAQSPALESALAERSIPYQVRDADGFYSRGEVRQALHDLARRVQEGRAEPAADQVRDVLGGLGWSPEPPSGAGAVRERWESLAALAELAMSLMGAEDTPLAAVVAALQERADVQQVPTADGVTLSTLHAAKGLEWDAVALVGAQEGLLPFVLAQRPEQIAEERRLLYVGITRARRLLRISWCRSRNGNKGRSRFLSGVRAAQAPAARAASSARPSGRRSRVCVSCGQPLTTGAELKLRRHESCPATYDPATLDLLIEWRRQVAAEQSVPAYVVFTDATLIAAAEAEPGGPEDLLRIAGIGRTKLDRYGDDVLAIIAAGRARREADTAETGSDG
ncbi:ATP-dependent DNA helicase UvrD2 [Propionicicella superfundia]|uniref:ATP-dependent DNA helicase UvrD2 n=1 Tax=Propionicicella superfundia TaxID=348582 RepID=UPI0003FF4B55|nr:ATP-dependent DNA helicase UvrD2 [Propionicicella superfundia]